MTVRDQLMTALKAAMKSGDTEKKMTIRAVQAAVKQVEIDQKKTLNDADVLAIVQKEVKSLRESVADSEKADRPEMAEQGRLRIAMLEEFLPAQMSRDEIASLVTAAIAETGASSPKDMGAVMKVLMPKTRGKADGKLVSSVVSELLRNAG